MSNPNRPARGPREVDDLDAERAVIAAAQAGDQSAKVALLDRYRPLRLATLARARKRFGLGHHDAEDLLADLDLVTLEAIRDFDAEKYATLSAVLPSYFQGVVAAVSPAATVPRSVLARYFKALAEADGDPNRAADLAPSHDLSRNAFWAVRSALTATDLEAAKDVPVTRAGRRSTLAEEDYVAAHSALAVLTDRQRLVVGLAYGFGSDPMSDGEIARELGVAASTVTRTRQLALTRMREHLTAAPEPASVGG